jgi:hypothetical protein
LAISAACVPCSPTTPSDSTATEQGLTLFHFSAQRKHFLWDMMGGFSSGKNIDES